MSAESPELVVLSINYDDIHDRIGDEAFQTLVNHKLEYAVLDRACSLMQDRIDISERLFDCIDDAVDDVARWNHIDMPE